MKGWSRKAAVRPPPFRVKTVNRLTGLWIAFVVSRLPERRHADRVSMNARSVMIAHRGDVRLHPAQMV